MKRKVIPILLVVFIALFLVVVVPILINESYKARTIYVTAWDAADVLSYYGMILAALIGVVGVYLTVYAANKNYREDARNRILPYISVNVVDRIVPDPFIVGFNRSEDKPSDVSQLADKADESSNDSVYFMISKKGVAVFRELSEEDLNLINSLPVVWKRGVKDERMYIRNAKDVNIPFEIENIGNGSALRLSVGLKPSNKKVHFETEITLKQNQSRRILIYSKERFEEIAGEYTVEIKYRDISGNWYEQLFPVSISVDEKKRTIQSIDLEGEQKLLRGN